jgi:hypothetical protein
MMMTGAHVVMMIVSIQRTAAVMTIAVAMMVTNVTMMDRVIVMMTAAVNGVMICIGITLLHVVVVMAAPFVTPLPMLTPRVKSAKIMAMLQVTVGGTMRMMMSLVISVPMLPLTVLIPTSI